jgi:hypothetical protein
MRHKTQDIRFKIQDTRNEKREMRIKVRNLSNHPEPELSEVKVLFPGDSSLHSE